MHHLDVAIVGAGFLVGPQVRHDARIYCFIYKFRQRFGLIAESIGQCLARDTSALRTGAGAWRPFGNSECCEGCTLKIRLAQRQPASQSELGCVDKRSRAARATKVGRTSP